MRSINLKSLLIMGAVLATTAAFAEAHVETGSFLNKSARTSEQLCEQMQNDSQVRDRYERHFQMSDRELMRMFRHLHASRLNHSGSYVVYNVHNDNIIRARVFMLKAGTGVFVDDAGTPILKLSCGNPMIAPTPKVVIVVPPTKPAPPVITPPPPVEIEKNITIITPPAPEAPPVIQPAAPVTNIYKSGNVYNSAKSSLFILPILLFINNHHTNNNCCTQKQPVPEPASMLAMGLGISTLVARRRRKANS